MSARKQICLAMLALLMMPVAMVAQDKKESADESKLKSQLFVKLKIDVEKTIEHLVKVKEMDEDRALEIAKRVKDATIHFQKNGKVVVDEGGGETQTSDWSNMKVDIKKKQITLEIEESKITISVKPHGVFVIDSRQISMVAVVQKREDDDDDDDQPTSLDASLNLVTAHGIRFQEQDQKSEKADDDKKNAKALSAIAGTWKANEKKTTAYLKDLEGMTDEMVEKAARFCKQGIQVAFTKEGKMGMSEHGDNDRMADLKVAKIEKVNKQSKLTVEVSMFDSTQSFSVLILDKDTLAITPPESNEPPLVFSRQKEEKKAESDKDDSVDRG